MKSALAMVIKNLTVGDKTITDKRNKYHKITTSKIYLAPLLQLAS